MLKFTSLYVNFCRLLYQSITFMKEQKINRRYFLQALGTVAAVSSLPVLASNAPTNTTSNNKSGSSNIKQLDDNYIMVDGWVLHKSDLDL